MLSRRNMYKTNALPKPSKAGKPSRQAIASLRSKGDRKASLLDILKQLFS